MNSKAKSDYPSPLRINSYPSSFFEEPWPVKDFFRGGTRMEQHMQLEAHYHRTSDCHPRRPPSNLDGELLRPENSSFAKPPLFFITESTLSVVSLSYFTWIRTLILRKTLVHYGLLSDARYSSKRNVVMRLRLDKITAIAGIVAVMGAGVMMSSSATTGIVADAEAATVFGGCSQISSDGPHCKGKTGCNQTVPGWVALDEPGTNSLEGKSCLNGCTYDDPLDNCGG
jgi:hypothetical protein